MVTCDMPPTKSRPEWGYVFLPTVDAGGNRGGVFTVREEQRGARYHRTVSDRYEFEFDTEHPARAGGVAILVAKTHHFGDLDTAKGRKSAARVGEVYRCEVWEGGHHCTCTAGATEEARRQQVETADCVHSLVLADLVASGELDAPHPLDRQANTGEDASAHAGEADEPSLGELCGVGDGQDDW